MTWTFILGVVYGILFLLNVKLCQRWPEDSGVGGSFIGLMVLGFSSLIALGTNGGPTAQQWMAPFFAILFIFVPNFITAAGFLLNYLDNKEW